MIRYWKLTNQRTDNRPRPLGSKARICKRPYVHDALLLIRAEVKLLPR